MLRYNGDFGTGINSASREVGCKIAYLNENDEVNYLSGTEIQSLNYTSQGKKELGCVVRKVVDGTLMYSENTSKLKKGAFISLIYTCLGECKVDIFYISDIKVKNDKQKITFQAVDMITYLTLNPKNIGMPLVKDTDLESYVKVMMDALGFECKFGTITNPKLTIGYPKSTDIAKTFEEMAIAGNCMIALRCIDTFAITLPFYLPRNFDELIVDNTVKGSVKPFKFTNPCTTIRSYINYEISEDSNMWDDVKVCLFFPGNSDQKSLGTMKTLVPASTNNYNIGTLKFNNTCIPQVCKMTGRVNVDDYRLGSDSCSFRLSNTGVLTQNIDAEFFGADIAAASTLESNTDNDSNIKVINNMYIQGAAVYNTRIYKNKDIDISYFGNPLIEVGDTVEIDSLKVLVIEHTLKFSGGLRGNIKGVVLSE